MRRSSRKMIAKIITHEQQKAGRRVKMAARIPTKTRLQVKLVLKLRKRDHNRILN
jgi:hypothetical protein